MPITYDRQQAPDTPDGVPIQEQNWTGLDDFTGAPKPPQDDRFGQLANALGSFNENLKMFGHAYSRDLYMQQRLQGRDQVEQARGYIASHTPDQFLADSRAGKLPQFTYQAAKDHMALIDGQYEGQQLSNDIQAKIGTGELTPDTAQAYALQRKQEILQERGWNDPNSMQAIGFGGHFNQLFTQLGKAHQKQIVQDFNTAQQTTAFKQVEMTMDQASQQGLDVGKSWDQLNQVRKSLTGPPYNFKPADVDQIIMNSLGRRAKDNPNWAVGMATMARPDLNGGNAPVPPLADNPKFASEVDRWRQMAQVFNAKVGEGSVKAQVAAQDVDALKRADGSFNMIHDTAIPNPNAPGQTVEMKSAQRRDAAITAYQDESDRIAQANHETPEQTFNREAPVYINNDVERPAWKKSIEGAVNLANQTGLTNPQNVQTLVAAGQTYHQLQMMSPAYVKDHFSEKARTFFDTYSVLKQYGSDPNGNPWDDTRAMNAAAQAIAPQSPDKQTYQSEVEKQVKSKIGDVSNPHGGIWTPFKWAFGQDVSSAKNIGQAMSEVSRLATALARSGGMDADTAVDQAVKAVARNSVVRNGQWMPKTNLLGVGVNDDSAFNTASNAVIHQYVERHGRDFGYTPADLTVKSLGAGYFGVTDQFGLPVEGGPRLTRPDLINVLNTQRQKAIDEQYAKQHPPFQADRSAFGSGTNPDLWWQWSQRNQAQSSLYRSGYPGGDASKEIARESDRALARSPTVEQQRQRDRDARRGSPPPEYETFAPGL